jgi:RES domain
VAGRARDIDLLDLIDAFKREPFAGAVWRVVREERDPSVGSPSSSRWCNGTFDVLCTSLEADGAVAEVHAYLALQPVFPSKIFWSLYRIDIEARNTLRLADLPMLTRLGVDTSRYGGRKYDRTQQIADAAYFLDFDGLIAPSARWDCLNLVLFTERIGPEAVKIGAATTIVWSAWRKRMRRRGITPS